MVVYGNAALATPEENASASASVEASAEAWRMQMAGKLRSARVCIIIFTLLVMSKEGEGWWGDRST